ncbi:HtaA domain-containing protein [Streptomyces sp. SP18ES09]|uniref:HtaA domain-containing protein n=1 Tax=Streptomyces sp. SP18ES09 TaxID=3002532 RepID=UPI002E78693F|nr:HtaA domain-containing protein [Streptomyces sp. SP18ES09]MEE1818414.1 HtaA domain-containing protein [Streptomyces sp. SP18ES09]
MAIPLRRSVTLAAAVATAAALGTGAVVLALPAAAEGAPAMTLVDGTLDWGIKQSFRTYLAMPFSHGKTTVEGGARQAENNGVFTFVDGTGTYDMSTHGTANSVKGGVHFEAHEGALDIRISDVRLTTKGTAAPTGEITADVVTKEKDGSVSTREDIPFAALDMTGIRPGQGAGGAMVFKDIPAKLTKDGAAAFAGFYKEGDALDAATLTVKAGSRPTTPPTTEPPTAEPPTTAPPTTEPPTTAPPTTEPPTTAPPTTEPPTTAPPTTAPPTTAPPTTEPPTTAPPTTAPPTTAPPTTAPAGVVDGRLTWGVKESWQRYVGQMCGGKVTASGGAERNGSAYDFGFVKADLDADARKLDAAFSGKLAFVCSAHGIDWTISDLKVRASGATGTLTADVTSAQGARNDVAFASLDLSKSDWSADEQVVTLADVPATLTEAGSATFTAPGGQGGYPAGTELDALTVSFSLADGATLPPATGGTGDSGGSGSGGSGSGGSGTSGGDGSSTTGGGGTVGGGVAGGSSSVGGSGSLAATGSGVPTTLLLGATALTVAAGAGIVVAARRRTTGS